MSMIHAVLQVQRPGLCANVQWAGRLSVGGAHPLSTSEYRTETSACPSAARTVLIVLVRPYLQIASSDDRFHARIGVGFDGFCSRGPGQSGVLVLLNCNRVTARTTAMKETTRIP